MYKKNKIISSMGDIVHRKPKYLSMKLAIALMFASVFQASAFTFGQTVTLKKKNVRITNVLKDIQKQSGYNIFYDSSFFPSNLLVSVDFDKKPFDKALESLLKDYAIDYNIVDKNVILRRKPTAARMVNTISKEAASVQQSQIRGTVKNAEGEPLSNVSITEKGGTASTMTNEQGNFEITVSKSDAVLVISNIGFEKQEIALANRSSIQVTLLPAMTEVDEVVVVGYGEQKKVNLTGAVSQISGEEFEDRPFFLLAKKLIEPDLRI